MQTTTIDNLPQAQVLDDGDRFPVNQNGVTRRAGLGAVKDHIQANLIAALTAETQQRTQGDISALNSAKTYTDQRILGGQEWLPPVMATSELQTVGLESSRNYLCKVVADPVQSGVYQAVAGWTTAPDWELYNAAVDLVSEPEMDQAISVHDTDATAHDDIRQAIEREAGARQDEIEAVNQAVTDLGTTVSGIGSGLSGLNDAVAGGFDELNRQLRETNADLENTNESLWGVDDGTGTLVGGRIPGLENDIGDINEALDGIQALELTGSFLTRIINGLSPVAKNLFDPSAVFVTGKTLINDENGTLGEYAGDIDSATIEVRTITITHIGLDEPTLLGNVDTNTDLPLTVSDAELLGWNTPRIDDYARVAADETMSGKTVEWYISAIDASGNITWANPVVINTGDYQEQTTAQDSGRVLTGGASAGTFGESLGVDQTPTEDSPNLITSRGVAAAVGAKINKSGDAMQGPLNFANGAENMVGDDASFGDGNQAGALIVRGLNANGEIIIKDPPHSFFDSAGFRVRQEINAKAPADSPVFTGDLRVPASFALLPDEIVRTERYEVTAGVNIGLNESYDFRRLIAEYTYPKDTRVATWGDLWRNLHGDLPDTEYLSQWEKII